MKDWTKSMMAAGLALATGAGLARAQAPNAPGAAPNAAAGANAGQAPGELPGPIDSLGDLQDTGQMLFKTADTNNDGQISQKEAVDAGNLVVGGFFFRADQNGDGTLSQDEANQARQALLAQQPLLRYVIQKGKAEAGNNAGGNAAGGNAAATDPAKAIGNFLDGNNDNQLQAAEVRQAVQTGVQAMFAAADTNRDNQMSPAEINAAILGVARTAAQAAFNEADNDRNGSLSRDEFTKAITEPANMVFAVLDVNGDGQISQQEIQRAQQVVGQQLNRLVVPEPANSARNLLQGADPNAAAPIPGTPGAAPRR